MNKIEYGTGVIINDGQGSHKFGLVFSSRNDLDEYPVITGFTLNPKFDPKGAPRGNMDDAIEKFFDLAYCLDPEKAGYSFEILAGSVPAEHPVKQVVNAAPVLPVPPDMPVPPAFEPPVPVAIVGGVPVPIRMIGEGVASTEDDEGALLAADVDEHFAAHSGATVPPQSEHVIPGMPNLDLLQSNEEHSG
jgi:hypothetical protein